MLRKLRNSIFFSVLLYIFFGVLWIYLSDGLLFFLVSNRQALSQAQTIKGWFFILFTALIFYFFIKKHKSLAINQEKEHQKIIVNVPLPMIEVTHEGIIIMVNQAFTRIYGYKIEDIPDTDKWFFKLYPNEDYRNRVRRDWDKRVSEEEREEFVPHIYTINDSWNKKRTVEFLVLKKNNSSLLICKDITQQKVLEDEKILENKMMALGELAGGIAHDFNNQLTGILGFTDLLAQSIDRNSPEQEYLSSIISATETSAKLTSELLAYTRNRTGESESVDMRGIIDEIETIVKRTFPMQFTLTKDIETDRLTVSGNSSRLQSMLLNLVINSKDAMSKGGHIGIRVCTMHRPSEQINGLPLIEGYHLIIEISDEGKGISPDQLNRIFEPLYTTKEKGHGTGMGLAMVYSTLRAHGGSIEVESQLEKGSLFRIYLPLEKR